LETIGPEVPKASKKLHTKFEGGECNNKIEFRFFFCWQLSEIHGVLRLYFEALSTL